MKRQTTPLKRLIIIQCFQISGNNTKTLFCLYSMVETWARTNNEHNLHRSLLPVFTNIAYELILNGDNPTHCFEVIEKLFAESDDLDIISCSVGLIAEMIQICPVLYMEELLHLCMIHFICINARTV